MASGGKHFKGPGAETRPPAPRPAARAPRGVGAVSPKPYVRPARPRAGGKGGGRASARDIVSRVLIAIGVILLLVSGGLFVHAQLGYKRASEYYDGLSKDVLKIDDSTGDGIPTIDFDALKKVNEDVVGWIYIPGTNVNYVVAKGKTNDTYLRHLITGEYNANGTVFMDADDAAPGLVDQQTTLYGHHMNDGSMFSAVHGTLSQEEFDKVKKVYYITPDATYELKPMFTMKVEDDYVDARVANFASEDAFRQYLGKSLEQASSRADGARTEVGEAHKVLTLITCDDAFLAQTKRVAMVCTLIGTVGEGE